MPGYDGFGPDGRGPLTGRGFGYCNGRGFGRFAGGRCFGRGYGFRRAFRDDFYAGSYERPLTKTEEKKILEEELKEIEEEKKAIESKLKEIK